MNRLTSTAQPLRLAILRRFPLFNAIHTVEITNGFSLGCELSEFGNVFACDAALISDDVEISPKDANRFMWVHLEPGGRRLSFQKGFERWKYAEEAARQRAVLVEAIYDPYFIERHSRSNASPSYIDGGGA